MQPGQILSEAWALYKAHWQHLLPIAFLVYVALSLITLLLVLIAGWLGAIVAVFVSLAGIFWLQGALVEAVSDVRDGRADLSMGETLRRVKDRIPPLAGAGILAALGIVIGLALLIVPGLVLLTWWSLIVPLIVLERSPALDSFGRSRDLVRGNGWNVFGVIVLTILILIAVSIVISIAFFWLPDALDRYLIDVVRNTLTAPFVALAWTLMYFRLREIRATAEPGPAPAV